MNGLEKKSNLLALSLLGVIAAIQGSGPNISSTALVGASRGLDMVAGTQAIAASAQTLAIAASVISTGLLADRIGRRTVLVAALLLGAIGNLTIMVAPNALMYIVGQALTGVGLGAAYAAAFAFIKIVATPDKIAAAMGTFAAVTGTFTVIFTFLGGTLASANWRLAFVLLPVMSLLSCVAVLALLPKTPPLPHAKHSIIGQIFLALGLVSLLYGISQLATSLTGFNTWAPIVLGVMLLALFVLSQAKGKNPFFPVSLFRKPLFLAAIAAGFVYNFGNAVAFLQMTNLWQYVVGLNTSQVSIWQLPLLLAGIVAALIFGRLMTKGMSTRVTLLIGAVMTSAGFIGLYLARAANDLLAFVPGAVLVGAGVIIASLPYGTLILSQAPEKYFGPVTSSRTTFGQLFFSIGLAFSTVIIDQLTRGGVVQKLTAAGVPADQIGTGLSAVTAFAADGTTPSTSLGQEALKSASASYIDSFGSMMLIAAALTLVVGIAGYLLVTHANKHTDHQ